jgi:hypothetical protein
MKGLEREGLKWLGGSIVEGGCEDIAIFFVKSLI